MLAWNVVRDVEEKLTLFFVVGRVALIRRFYHFAIKINMVCRSAPRRVLVSLFVVGESKARFAVLAIVFVVIESWLEIIFTFPAEPRAVILRV